MSLNRSSSEPGLGPIAGLAIIALPAMAWWVGLALCLRAGRWLALAWIVGPGVLAMAVIVALEVALLRWFGLWSPVDGGTRS